MDDYYWCEKCRNRSSARFANSEPICWGCGGDMEWREGKASKLERIVMELIKLLEGLVENDRFSKSDSIELDNLFRFALKAKEVLENANE